MKPTKRNPVVHAQKLSLRTDQDPTQSLVLLLLTGNRKHQVVMRHGTFHLHSQSLMNRFVINNQTSVGFIDHRIKT